MPPPERRKVAVACENCRLRKVRCDGLHPVCRACKRRGDACSYTVSLAPWDRQRQKYVEELEKKVQVLEARHTSPLTPTTEVTGDAAVTCRRGNEDRSPPMFDHDWQGNTDFQVAPDCPPQLTGSIHIGRSSTGVFIRELQNTVTRPAMRAVPAITLDDLATHTPVGSGMSSDHVLPPRKAADDLLKIYHAVHYPVYPTVCWDDFLVDLEALYAGSLPPNKTRVAHCLVNLMFALAERGTLRESSRGASPDYFERAKRLLQFDIFGAISFQVIQALVLCAQYLQSAEKPRQCWVIVGLAIRAAQSIGLHLSEAVKNIQPERDRLLAAIVWSCLVTMDRTLSMTLGRSPTLSLLAARATGISSWQLSSGQGPWQIPRFFIESHLLFDILHEILVSLYGEGVKTAPGLEILSHTSRLERGLDCWASKLPEELSLYGSESVPSQSHFLRQRYLQVRMILLRPGLSTILKSPSATEWDLEEATTSYCATKCIEAASEMADLAMSQSQADSNGTSVAPWWFNVQFCYNAGATLLAARLSSKVSEQMGLQALDQSLGKCVQTLK